MDQPKIVLHHLIVQEAHWKIKLLEHWSILSKHIINAPVVLVKISDHSLLLGVTHSIWAQEVSMCIPTIKKVINNFLGSEVIHTIFIKVIMPPINQSSMKPTQSLQSKPEKHYALSTDEQQCLTQIDDIQLQKNIEQFLMRCKRHAKES